MSLLLFFTGGGLGSPATQTIEPSLLIDTDTINAHVVTATGALSASLFVDGDTFDEHTLIQEGMLEPELFANANTFNEHTLIQEQLLVPELFDDGDVFFGHAVGGGHEHAQLNSDTIGSRFEALNFTKKKYLELMAELAANTAASKAADEEAARLAAKNNRTWWAKHKPKGAFRSSMTRTRTVKRGR